MIKTDNRGSAEIAVLFLVVLTVIYVIGFMELEETNRSISQELSRERAERTRDHDRIEKDVEKVKETVQEDIIRLSDQSRRESESVKETVREEAQKTKEDIAKLSDQNRKETENITSTVRDVGGEINAFITQNKGLSKFDMLFILGVVGIGLVILLMAINSISTARHYHRRVR